jgi:phospholipid N-methyltransferase
MRSAKAVAPSKHGDAQIVETKSHGAGSASAAAHHTGHSTSSNGSSNAPNNGHGNGHAKQGPKAKKSSHGPQRFLKAALKSPRQIGSVIPSSPFLGKAMMRLIDLPAAKTVVEYGPGTGSITKVLLKHLGTGAKFFAIELNDAMAQSFAHNYPQVKLYHRSIADIEAICVAEGLTANNSVDVIISGIPWAVLPEAVQTTLLAAAARALRPGGVMLTYGYHGGLLLKAGRNFAKTLPKHFSHVTRSAPVWLNVPPAFVYRCEK